MITTMRTSVTWQIMYFATHGMQDSMILFMKFVSQPSKTTKNKTKKKN